MVTYIRMPKLGLTMTEGIVVNWLKKEGDWVEKGEALLEVETEKIVNEIEAAESGILFKIVALEGTVVPVSGLVAIIAKPGEEVPPIEETLKAEMPAKMPEVEKPKEIEKPTVAPVPKERIKISPVAKKIAKERKIDVTNIKGTGPGGRIVKKDVLSVLDETKAPTAAPIAPPAIEPVKVEKIIDIIGIRKTISERLSQSYRTAVHTILMTRVDMTETIKLRRELLAEMEKTAKASLTYTGILVKAVAIALKDHPIINSTLEGDKIKILEDINVGVAVALEEGLIVPVVQNADKKALSEIALCLTELTEKAKHRLLSSDEVTRGTFTITNLGMYGIDTFVPIINPPESAILGVGEIDEKPVVADGHIVVRSVMNLSLVFDHRVFGGAQGAKFLQTLKRILENPSTLLN
ncbi:2-oxo acid dehydrogenase subunit E2 [Candidatus Bathyarchaeota archaeon]|nr:2-oxo acid dehydrogenase subunit E2 [Candidatus Bathyarchaeota archaeon]